MNESTENNKCKLMHRRWTTENVKQHLNAYKIEQHSKLNAKKCNIMKNGAMKGIKNEIR